MRGLPSLVVLDLLEQGLTGACRDAAVLLAGDDEWTEHEAAVVHRDVAQEAGPSGLGVDFDDGHVGPEGEAGPGLLEDQGGAEAIGLDLSFAAGRDLVRPALGPALGIGSSLGHLGQLRPEPGTPATARRPLSSSTMSSGAASSRWPTSFLALASTASAAWSDCGAADLQGARPSGAATHRDEGGVGLDELDVVHGDAQPVGYEHGEAGVVALAVGRRPDPDGGAPVLEDLDRPELARHAACGDLDVAAEADAELERVTPLPPGPLLLAEIVVAGQGSASARGLGYSPLS